MAIWLWINDLESAGKNDWIKVVSVGTPASRQFQDVNLVIEPGRFYARLVQRSVRGTSSDAFVFVDPQTEVQYHDAIITSFTTSKTWDKPELLASISLNFRKQTVSYAGGP
jgi:hypothetical protein